MSLKQAILQVHELHGINRATGDLDLLIDEKDLQHLISQLGTLGFLVRTQTPEVLHFEGPVRLDILLARRPISRQMLARAKTNPVLWERIQSYADTFGEWPEIEKLK